MARPTGPPLSRVLLVEGQDDEHVVRHIRERCTADSSFCTIIKGGIDELLKSIVRETRVSGRQTLGILTDANTNPAERWDEVKDQLASANICLPDSPNASGTIVDGRPRERVPRVGVWLMPNNSTPGELEDFVAKMIPCQDPVWPLSQCYIDGIPKKERKFRENKILKAQVHAWLATRAKPRLMGAIRAGDLEIDGPLCQEFVVWLTRLFR